jgi:arylsulfatase A-like enzyme
MKPAIRLLPILVSLLVGCRLSGDREATPPNFVLIFVDDVGYGDLGSFGHPTIRTPVLDRMAAEGIKLTSFYAASPACSPSRIALLTGRYPIRTGLVNVLGPDETGGIAAHEITLAEALQELGYRTAAIGKWHLGAVPGHFATEHGFDSYYGLLYSNDMIRPWVGTDRPLELYRDTLPIEHPVDQSTLTLRYTQEAVRFIRQSQDQPFFLYLAHTMAHVPLHRSGAFAGKSKGGLYGDVIEELDWSVGQVLDALAETGVAGNTLVVFTSDNGPWNQMPNRMFAGDMIKPWDAGTTGPLRGTKATTYEGGMRVPFVARWPGRIPAGQVSGELATTMDLYTTFLGLAGAAVPADRPVDGRDIWPLLAGSAGSPHDYFYYMYPARLEGVRDAEWKLRVARDADGAVVTELYDMASDPYERFDVAAAHPEVVARLRAALERFAAETGAQLPGSGER